MFGERPLNRQQAARKLAREILENKARLRAEPTRAASSPQVQVTWAATVDTLGLHLDNDLDEDQLAQQLVEAADKSKTKLAGESGPFEHVVKLIPAPAVAAFLVFESVAAEANAVWLWIATAVLAIASPFLATTPEAAKRRSKAVVEGFVVFFAFLAWAYTIGGPFASLPSYSSTDGTIGLGIVSILAAFTVKLSGAKPAGAPKS